MTSTIDWSYQLLDPPERDLFARLSVFVGGFTLESAQAACDGESDVLEGVSSLIEKSFVVAQERPDVEPRFRMLETVRAYARERLEHSGTPRQTKLAMAHYFAQLADQAVDGLSGIEHNLWLSRLDAEVDNLRAAMTWAFGQWRTRALPPRRRPPVDLLVATRLHPGNATALRTMP